jgi:plasmid stabilization system protein ParE
MESKLYRTLVSPDTEQDVQSIYEWLELEENGLGQKFYWTFFTALKLLTTRPLLYAKIVTNFRRLILWPYQYSMYYWVDEKKRIVKVVAVIHHKRSNKYIRKRLKY